MLAFSSSYSHLQKGILLTQKFYCCFMFVSGDVTKEWATRALQNFGKALKSTAASSSRRDVWFVVKHTEKKDDVAPFAATIASHFGLSRSQEMVFWNYFPSKRYISRLKLYLPETEFQYSEFRNLKIIRCNSWPKARHCG